MSRNNRWGNRNTVKADDDQAALDALLMDAEKRTQTIQSQKSKSNPQTNRWGDRDGRNNQSASSNSRKKEQDDSDPKNDYYQPQSKRQRKSSQRDKEKDDSKYAWGGNESKEAQEEGEDETEEAEKQLPNFGLSGALANDDKTGNTYNGILLKFSEPPEARTPNTRWRLYVFKKSGVGVGNKRKGQKGDDNNGDLVETLHISKQSAYLFGREVKVVDIAVHHPSLSKQHCVLQYRSLPDKNDREGKLRCKPYLMDLKSTNGTFINGERLDDARYYELMKGDVITLGSSSREYVLLTENTTSTDL